MTGYRVKMHGYKHNGMWNITVSIFTPTGKEYFTDNIYGTTFSFLFQKIEEAEAQLWKRVASSKPDDIETQLRERVRCDA